MIMVSPPHGVKSRGLNVGLPRGAGRSTSASLEVSRVAAPVAAFVLVAPVPIIRILPGAVSVSWNLLVLAILCISAVLGLLLPVRASGVWIFAGAAAIVAAVTTTQSTPLASNLVVGIHFAALFAIGPFFARWLWVNNPRAIRAGALAFLLVQTASAAAAVVQTAGIPVLGYVSYLGRAPGLAGHPNLLGVMAGVAIVLLLNALRRSSVARMVLLVPIGVNVAGLVVTGSISAMIATSLGLIVFLIASRVSPRYIVVALILLAVLGTFFAASNSGDSEFRDPLRRVSQVTGQTGEVSTLFARVGTVQAAWSQISKDPFVGVGLTDATAGTGQDNTFVHNLPMRAWFQGGLTLFIGISLIVVVSLAIAVLCAVRGRYASQASVIVVLLGFSLTSAFFDDSYYWMPVVAAYAAIAPATEAGRMRWRPSREPVASGSRAALIDG